MLNLSSRVRAPLPAVAEAAEVPDMRLSPGSLSRPGTSASTEVRVVEAAEAVAEEEVVVERTHRQTQSGLRPCNERSLARRTSRCSRAAYGRAGLNR